MSQGAGLYEAEKGGPPMIAARYARKSTEQTGVSVLTHIE